MIPIVVTLVGIVTVVSDVHPVKAALPNGRISNNNDSNDDSDTNSSDTSRNSNSR